MTGVLDTPRQISLGGKVETFRNYAYLAERGQVFAETMQRIERDLDVDPVNAAKDWGRLADLADLLSEVLAAQDQWVADHDAEIAADIEKVRGEIRNINLPSDMNEPEAQA